MTRRRAPLSSPRLREELTPGTAEWCRQTVNHARTLWAAKIDDERRWANVLEELRDGRAWKPLGHRSLTALLRAEIGVGLAESLQTVKLRARGRPKSDDEKGYTVPFSARGNNPQYKLARLARDRADLHARVLAGELSANAAMVEAGFRPPAVTLRLDRLEPALRVLLKHFTADEIRAALAAMG